MCDGILHVNMFHYLKIPYFTCTFFTKFTYNEYIGPYFLSHVVLQFFASDLPDYTIPRVLCRSAIAVPLYPIIGATPKANTSTQCPRETI
jgi:hypothetical protein